eukprot:TRINITY_DN828_c0_g2_i1.p1 TRINITY_DN828_c0_g2~~TRINITY_DN828_c0_g2_i1.p1  ORF type:complete len:138 (-),score=7.46 TRINITY_DN828_c0_g2_i1:5-418(-)
MTPSSMLPNACSYSSQGRAFASLLLSFNTNVYREPSTVNIDTKLLDDTNLFTFWVSMPGISAPGSFKRRSIMLGLPNIEEPLFGVLCCVGSLAERVYERLEAEDDETPQTQIYTSPTSETNATVSYTHLTLPTTPYV